MTTPSVDIQTTRIPSLCCRLYVTRDLIWFDLSTKARSGQFIAITASRSDVEACKSKAWFPVRCNQSAGIPITNVSLSHSADRQQNALHDNESHEETTEDHCSRRSDVRYGNTCFWFDGLASVFSSRNKVIWLPFLSLLLHIGLLKKLLGEFSSNFRKWWVLGQEVDFGVMNSGCFTNTVRSMAISSWHHCMPSLHFQFMWVFSFNCSTVVRLHIVCQ